ncbi:MAG: thioredoxin [Acidobacteria bacterium]|nr:thioredoxin [Acidobacteriota bacterium]
MAANVIEVTDASFESEVLSSNTPVLVDFWAVWCAPCKMLAPTVEAVATDKSGSLKVAKLNVDDNPSTAARYSIKGIPTLILYKEGQEKERIVGVTSKENILSAIGPHLG